MHRLRYPAPVPAKRCPGRPRKRPSPVDVDDRFVQTWYASLVPSEQKPLTSPNLTAMATSSLSSKPPVLTKFQASHTAERRFNVREY